MFLDGRQHCILHQKKIQYKCCVIYSTQNKCDTNIKTLLLTTVKIMILHLLKKVKVLGCLMVFNLEM